MKQTDWVAVEAAYCAGEQTIKDIAQEFGTSVSAISWRRKTHGWVMRKPNSGALDRSQLIHGMFRVLERQLIGLRETMSGKESSEVQILGNLVKTLDKLIELDNNEKTANKASKFTKGGKDMQKLRSQLADRILDINKQ